MVIILDKLVVLQVLLKFVLVKHKRLKLYVNDFEKVFKFYLRPID